MKRKTYKTLYIDMDNTIVDFDAEPNAVARFREEPNFFFNLKPLARNLEAVKQLIENPNYRVFILSASPNENCDNDKRRWLEKYLPNLNKKNILICRLGENKSDYMKYKGVLLDDYPKNVISWIQTTKCMAYRVDGDGAIQAIIDWCM